MAARKLPITVVHEQGSKFEMKGDYYLCSQCEQFAVHRLQENKCKNKSCSSNTKKKPPVRGYYERMQGKNCRKCQNRLAYSDLVHEQYEGLCARCYRQNMSIAQTNRSHLNAPRAQRRCMKCYRTGTQLQCPYCMLNTVQI